ncbi:MAG: fumarylacetoacetate hydrolase family protein [Oscillospiraceae bacterium]|nr:fumarylacetoacetate hydrolase family protein [Oscillospiraceae bacterium]
MKFCSISQNGRDFIGVVTDFGIVDVTAMGFPASMNEIIESGNEIIAKIDAAITTNNPHPIIDDNISYLPVTEPKKIICMGWNYAAHAQEGGSDVPEHPVFFSKFNDALSAHKQAVTLLPWFREYDYESELVIIIGKHAHNITTEEAPDYIFGYTCGNDMTAREAQRLSSQWLAGKSLPGFAPIGPHIVTSDSFDPDAAHRIYCEVNGITVQSAVLTDMIFKCYESVSAASRFFPLSPGDMIFTGTPEGIIGGKPESERVWLKAGDIVQVTIEGIGTLTTPLV